jgi:hypothetical protein
MGDADPPCGRQRARANRRDRISTAPRAILNLPPPEPKRKPTWQEQLSNVTNNGPSGRGRKNIGPRYTPYSRNAVKPPPTLCRPPRLEPEP